MASLERLVARLAGRRDSDGSATPDGDDSTADDGRSDGTAPADVPDGTTPSGPGSDDAAAELRSDDPTASHDQVADVRADGGRADDTRSDGDARADGGRADGGTARRQSPAGLRTRIGARFGEDFLESAPFWGPPFLLMAFFVYGAIGWNVIISLTDYEGFSEPDYSDLDFEMYERAFASQEVITASVNTFLLLLGFTVVSLVIGLLLAILLDRKIRFENTFRTIYLLPMSLSFVVTAQFWLWMYDFDGVANQLLGVIGLGPIEFIGNQSVVLWAIVFALVWQFSGYTMVVYLSALRAIPTDHFEAARVDGASTVKMYWRVIIPQLKSATVSASVVLMVFALKAFDFLFALVGGYQPPNGADILATKMVREAIRKQNWAYGSAIALILFVMALGIIGPYLYYEYTNDNL